MDIPSVGSTLPLGSPPPDKNVMPSGTTTSMSNAVQSPAPADTTSAETKKSTDPSQLKKAVDDINKTLQDRGQDVRFSIDESSKRVVVKNLIFKIAGKYPSVMQIGTPPDLIQLGLAKENYCVRIINRRRLRVTPR